MLEEREVFGLKHASSKHIATSEAADMDDREVTLQAAIIVLSQGLALLDSIGLKSAAVHVSLAIETILAKQNLDQIKPSSQT